MYTSEDLARRCAADGEFRLAARYWNGGLRLALGDVTIAVIVRDGDVEPGDPGDGPGVVTLSADAAVWHQMLAPVPARFANDIWPAVGLGLQRTGDDLTLWQYSPAIQRAVELLREPGATASAAPTRAADAPRFDSPVGRYVHVDLDGHDHRVYVEEAGTGIPMLLQHTAGSHGVQWRHLFECRAITDRFRLIAYDLPFHGKSIPPTTKRWWTERYELTGAALRAIPLAISAALGLERPAFMGCSVGGLLALDLAARHPDQFCAVVSLEGALHIGGELERLTGFWHPQVSGETKARMMEGLVSPTSPEALRKETSQTYASGWPPAFLGDLYYYVVDYDLTELAPTIDAGRVGVHILTGEYDYSATIEMGRAAHEAIAGSTFSVMPGLGHFPMCEDPERFLTHLLPVLDLVEREHSEA